jgi:nucleotide-binding universal stress UspA family protein
VNNTVLVGIDGSAQSATVFADAVAEARRRNARLRVISAFEPTATYAMRYGIAFPLADEAVAKNIEKELTDLVDPIADDLAADKLEVAALPGSPGAVLVQESQKADLLVVGHRGRGRAASTLLGSVGLYCVLHAHCPVLVVRPLP